MAKLKVLEVIEGPTSYTWTPPGKSEPITGQNWSIKGSVDGSAPGLYKVSFEPIVGESYEGEVTRSSHGNRFKRAKQSSGAWTKADNTPSIEAQQAWILAVQIITSDEKMRGAYLDPKSADETVEQIGALAHRLYAGIQLLKQNGSAKPQLPEQSSLDVDAEGVPF